jgi:hypothetical protein
VVTKSLEGISIPEAQSLGQSIGAGLIDSVTRAPIPHTDPTAVRAASMRPTPFATLNPTPLLLRPTIPNAKNRSSSTRLIPAVESSAVTFGLLNRHPISRHQRPSQGPTRRNICKVTEPLESFPDLSRLNAAIPSLNTDSKHRLRMV